MQMKKVMHLHLRLEPSHFVPQIQLVPGYDYMHLIRQPKYVVDQTMLNKKVVFLDQIESEKKFYKKHPIDIFHAHHADLGLLLLPLKKKHETPLVTSVRGRDATFADQPSDYHKQLKTLFKAGERFFPVCKYLAERIVDLGCPADKIRILYGGVNLDHFTYLSREGSNTQHILSVGRLVEKKGHHILMHAFAKIRRKFPKANLTVVGKGAMLNELKLLAGQLQLSESFRLVDFAQYNTVAEHMKNADIFCAASLTAKNGDVEGIPNTIKEAMAAGLPVVSTSHAGIPEIVTSGYNGLLVRENNVDELAAALEYMLSDPAVRTKFGKNARHTVEQKFNLSQQLKKQAEYYDELGGQQRD